VLQKGMVLETVAVVAGVSCESVVLSQFSLFFLIILLQN